MSSLNDTPKSRLMDYDDEWRALEPVTLLPEPKKSTPLAAWVLLTAALLAVSSAGTVFDILGRCAKGQAKDNKCSDGTSLIPAITLASWRLQLTTVLLIPGFVVQWRQMSEHDRSRAMRSVSWLLGSGTCLALHFGAWVWSLQHTSLPHSLLMVSASPIMLAILAALLKEPVTKFEAGGTLAAFAGSILLAVGAAKKEEDDTTLAGDMAALLAAFAFVGYITVGKQLRSWMPIFIYAAPVTGVSAIVTALVALISENISFAGSGAHGLFGYLTRGRYFGWVMYLAAGPGIVGHTGINTLLRWMSPLVIALTLQLEPLVGSVIGWCAGMVKAKELGAFTWTGGVIVLVGTVIVTWGHTLREQRSDDRKATTVALTEVFGNSERFELEDEDLGLLADETPKSAR